MNASPRTASVFLTVALLFGAPALAQVTSPPTDLAVATQQWSNEVWSAAIGGDQKALTEKFTSLPAGATDFDGAVRFRESFDLHLANDAKAITKRDEAREKALGEMRTSIAANDLSKALRSAVTVQTLSDNLDMAFDNPEIVKLIEQANERIPQAEADLDWLSAQELLYFLRTLYEDTGKFDQYKKYKDDLNAVNRRVSLLAQYAPHRLYDLRAKRAERLGDKPLPPYKPSPSNDWKSRMKGIKPDMLKAFMKTAANEHVDHSGWLPLLRGGLEELRLLGTTATLDETFPKLADSQAVGRWVNHLDSQLAEVKSLKDGDFDSWKFSAMLDELLRANQQTINLPNEVLYREFGDGALYELDEFSEIIWPDKLLRFRQATEGAFVGVGILIRYNDAQEIMVVNPIEGTPAYFGGVKPNDKIVEVDGDPTIGWTLNDAVDRITGAPATEVKLGLQREGVEDIVQLTLRRDVIKLRSVMGWWKKDLRADGTPEWDWYVDPISRIAYIKLTQFNEDSYNDLLAAWKEITEKGKPTGLVLDLRFNPGGLLTSAVQISNLFVKSGTVVSVEGKEGREYHADPSRAKLSDVPVVVLINQGSASASEIVSGCLKAHNAAVIVGERSYGKGSVQTVYPTSVTARLKLTCQYYRLPPAPGEEQGRLVHKKPGATLWGVDPDIKVKMTPQQIIESQELRQKADVIPRDENGNLKPTLVERPDVSKILAEGLDPQLDTALLILRARALGDSIEETRHALKK